MHFELRSRAWRGVSVLFVVAGMLLACALLPAAVSAGSDGVVPSSPAGDLIGGRIVLDNGWGARNPNAAWNCGANEYLVVWDGGNLVGSGTKVFAQRLSATGAALSAKLTLPAVDYEAHSPKVTYNPDRNEYLAVWHQVGGEITGQRISAGGALLGSAFDIGVNGRQDAFAAVVYNPDAHEYLVAWESNRSASLTYDIFVQRVSGTGTRLGGNLAVTGGAGDKLGPAIAYNRQIGEYMVVWEDERNGSNFDVYGQRIGQTGALVGQAIPIAATWGDQAAAGVAWSTTGSTYLVIWKDTRNGTENDIYGQKLTGVGILSGVNFPIATGIDADWGTELTWNGAGGEFLAAWGASGKAYAQRITNAGALRNTPIVVGSGTSVTGAVYNVAANEYLVSWGQGANAQRIRGQPPYCSSLTGISEGECEALVAFYADMGGTGWTNRSGWLATNTPCTWFGITCTDGHVTELELNENQLRGNLSGQLGNLWYLRRLSLYKNQITGVIPAELANLSNLQVISLAANQLSGTIPAWFGNLYSLTYLNLNVNQLSGTIPPALGNLTQLTALELTGNQLSGSIPSTLGNLVNLTQLNMYFNHLAGPIPPELGRLSHLIWLGLYHNDLSGPIPQQLRNLTSLRGLGLDTNPLTGSFPSWLGELGTLERIWLSNTQLTGPLPLNVTNLSLTSFWYDQTDLCEPADEGFHAWLGGINDLRRTGISCARLAIDHPHGAPDSYFVLTGESFPPNATIDVSINRRPLGPVQVAGDGGLRFALSTVDAGEGLYLVNTSVPGSPAASFRLIAGDNVWPQDTTTPLFAVPAGIAWRVAAWLPLVAR